jgi:hypothetical protein
MKAPSILSLSIVTLALPALAADTVQTFDGGGTSATATQSGTAPGAAVVGGGPTGNFLRLINDGVNGQTNHYAFDNTHGGNWSTITAQYDFRMGGSGGNADGISFLLIPTSVYGASGPGVVGFVAEEPNLPGVFAIGHDVYLDNAISLHWNGVEYNNFTANSGTVIDFAANVFHRAEITIQQAGNGANVTVQVTRDQYGTPVPFQVIRQAISLQPYENRVQFSGRTGGLDMNGDLDNILVQYSGVAAPLLGAPVTGRLYQDFDTANNTGYSTGAFGGDKNNPNHDAPVIVTSGGSDGGAFLRLAKDSQFSTNNSIAMDRAIDGGLATGRRVEVDFRLANPDAVTPADGLGILLLPTADFGARGNGPAPAYETPNVANTFGVGFHVYNGSLDNRITLHWDNAEVATTGTIPQAMFDLLNNQWNRAQIELLPAVGGANVSLTITPNVGGVPGAPVPIFSNYFIAGLHPYDYRVQVGARTGGLTIDADVDRITSQILTTGSPTLATMHDFNGGIGTGFQTYDLNAAGNLHPRIIAGGVSGNALRLIHASNAQNASIGFERSMLPGPKDFIVADFDFRMSSDNVGGGVQRADGVQLALLDVNTYGTSGPIDTVTRSYESEMLFGALSVGFDIFDGDINTPEDTLNLGYNGTLLAQVVFSPANFPGTWFDLNSDTFHHAKLTLLPAGANSLATLQLFSNIVGAPVTIFDEVFVPGLDLSVFDFRAAFGARTGGLNTVVDLDNIVVIPEPSAVLLLISSLGVIGLRRRRW